MTIRCENVFLKNVLNNILMPYMDIRYLLSCYYGVGVCILFESCLFQLLFVFWTFFFIDKRIIFGNSGDFDISHSQSKYFHLK